MANRRVAALGAHLQVDADVREPVRQRTQCVTRARCREPGGEQRPYIRC